MREAVALFLPVCAVGLWLPPIPVGAGRSSWLSTAALAVCLGVGSSSLTALALTVVGFDADTWAFVAADVAIWTIVGAMGWRLGRGRRAAGAQSTSSSHATTLSRGDRVVRAAFAATVVLTLGAVIASVRALPHGEWDAWAIWNQHARFLFHGDQWRALLAIEWSHPDYPLLLPASVARVWAYAGQETTLGPALIAMLFGASAVALVIAALDPGRWRAWVAGMLLLGAGGFIAQVPSQCADVPLACFMVATLAVTVGPAGFLARREGSREAALVAGAMSALAAWTKNEGLVFALMMLLLVAGAAVRHRHMRPVLWWVLGGAPVFVTLVWFKLWVAPATSLFVGQSSTIYLDRLFDLDRHLLVASLMARHLVDWGAPVTMAIIPIVGLTAIAVAVFKGGTTMRLMLAVVSLMLAVYYAVYLTTPFDVAWHISTSFDRLLTQLWPALVLAAFLIE